jgi:thiol-disulfide isomerase/thioredoxin
MAKLRRWAREGLILLVIAIGIGLAMDLLRAPQEPVGFASRPLDTVDGIPVSLGELSQDKPLIVYFWASWCGVCKFTTPNVAKLAANGDNVLTVSLRSGDEQQVKQWLARKQVQFPVVNDESGALSAQWKIDVTPTFVIISQGKVVQSTTGWTSYWGMKARLWWASV